MELITRRPEVQVLPPQPRILSADRKVCSFFMCRGREGLEPIGASVKPCSSVKCTVASGSSRLQRACADRRMRSIRASPPSATKITIAIQMNGFCFGEMIRKYVKARWFEHFYTFFTQLNPPNSAMALS